MKISVFETAMATKPIQTLDLDELVDIVRSPGTGGDLFIKADRIVEKIRTLINEDRQRELKLTLPAISPGAEFGSNRQEILSNSGLMQIDIDHVLYPEQLRDALGIYPWITLSALSVRKGVWLLIKIPEPERQPEYWLKINEWLKNKFGVEADPARKNPKDLRFYAPDPGIIYNPESIVLPPLPKVYEVEKANPPSKPRKSLTGPYFSPIDDFNSHADVIQMLLANGWKIYGQRGSNIRLTRPGKNFGISANWNTDLRKLYVFTSNSIFTVSTSGHPLSPVDIFMQINNINCLAVAREQLLNLNYGYQKSKILLNQDTNA